MFMISVHLPIDNCGGGGGGGGGVGGGGGGEGGWVDGGVILCKI